MSNHPHNSAGSSGQPWNKGRLIGPQPPLKLREIWAIRIRLQLADRKRYLVLFNLAIDSKLRGCDLVKLMVQDVAHGGKAVSRTTVLQQKTAQPVKFELTDQTREAVVAWIVKAKLTAGQCQFPGRLTRSPHISTRQDARIVKGWVARISLEPSAYGTHLLRRTTATLIYRRTKNLRAVQLLLGHTNLESTVHLGIDVDDALVDVGADRSLVLHGRTAAEWCGRCPAKKADRSVPEADVQRRS